MVVSVVGGGGGGGLFSIFIWVTPESTFENALRCFFWGVTSFFIRHSKEAVQVLTAVFYSL